MLPRMIENAREPSRGVDACPSVFGCTYGTTGVGVTWLRPDPAPDIHPWIIAALVLVIIWMWVHGVMVVWIASVKQRWPFPNTQPSMQFCYDRWRWRYLWWPLLWFWGGKA